jgi:hypothetical protein
VNLITILSRPARGASQVDKSPRLNWATQFLTVAYDGTVHIILTFLSEWREFPSAPFLAEKKIMRARVSILLKSRASPDMLLSAYVTRKDLQFGTSTAPSFQRHYQFRPTTSGNRSG